ncbi:MAG: hypothetical protein AB1792_08040 [Candidatus Zixiibacteriota bacterium]
MKRAILALMILSSSVRVSLAAQERLAVLPLRGIGVDPTTAQTVRLLLQSELTRLKKYEVASETEIALLLADSSCSDAACAAGVGRQLKVAKVVFGSLNRLGEKIIFQYHLVDVSSGSTLFSDAMSALHVEDLDQVTKRVAVSITEQTPAEKTVEVGRVTEQESLQPHERKANSSSGIGVGYLYPEEGYDDKQSFFIWDFRSLYEIRHVAVDALLGIRKGLAVNVGVMYLPSLRDFSPFVAGGLGFHTVDHEYRYDESHPYDEQDNKSSGGVEFLIKGGLLAFRTYDFRVIANFEYSLALNGAHDRGYVVTLGIMRAGKKIFGIF